jgi:hypothetical protein
MNTTNINQLIEKYFEGDTSLAEEAILREYFSKGSVSEELKPYEDIFRYMEEARAGAIRSDDFDQKTMHRIKRNGVFSNGRIQLFAAVAATIAFVIVGVFLFYPQSSPEFDKQLIVKKYSTKDPETAYKQTREALDLVSEKLNDGMKQMKEISVFYEYQTKLFNKSKVAL